MKNIIFLLSASATMMLTISCRPSQTPSSIAFHRQDAGEADNDGWFEARSTEGHFLVVLPAKFNDVTQIADSREGERIINHAVGANTSKSVKYRALVMVSADQKPLPENRLVTIDAKDPTLKDKREVEMDGHKGLELHFANAKSASKMRTFDSDGRRYLLMAEFPANADETLLEEVDKFLRSFKLCK
jgi:hypothetical protein